LSPKIIDTDAPDDDVKTAPVGKVIHDLKKKTGRAGVFVPVLAPGHPISVKAAANGTLHAPDARLAEALGLAAAIDLEVVAQGIAQLREINPATLIGSGKVEEIKQLVKADEIELIIIDYPLSPAQQRNLEKALGAKVVDRTGLILEIFGRRARTAEGKLQVELANLTYAKSRLVRAWTHLERQRGGSGFLGGPGETQIELDKRMLQDTIDAIKVDLQKVKRTRELHRGGRRATPYPIVALVGYTNAGKSTLFNTLTGAGVFAKDLLFATLDPTMREVKLESGRKLILADTVGFISELPTMLIAAFRATLEEVLEADVILHVRDIAASESDAQRADVLKVLKELGIATEGPDCPILEVWNKADLLTPERREELLRRATRETLGAMVVSAVTGDGVPELLAAVDARVGKRDRTLTLDVDAGQGQFLSWLHENSEVLDRQMTDEGRLILKLRIDTTRRGRLDAKLASIGPDAARIAT
jgi:GTPase